jgi:hypothetical protein
VAVGHDDVVDDIVGSSRNSLIRVMNMPASALL